MHTGNQEMNQSYANWLIDSKKQLGKDLSRLISVVLIYGFTQFKHLV